MKRRSTAHAPSHVSRVPIRKSCEVSRQAKFGGFIGAFTWASNRLIYGERTREGRDRSIARHTSVTYTSAFRRLA